MKLLFVLIVSQQLSTGERSDRSVTGGITWLQSLMKYFRKCQGLFPRTRFVPAKREDISSTSTLLRGNVKVHPSVFNGWRGLICTALLLDIPSPHYLFSKSTLLSSVTFLNTVLIEGASVAERNASVRRRERKQRRCLMSQPDKPHARPLARESPRCQQGH